MKRLIVGLLLGMLLFCSPGLARAITLGFDPVFQKVSLGASFDVALRISGLGDGTAPSLGVFDLDVTFDPTILGFSAVTYGDPLLGDQLDLFGLGSITATTPGVGMVNLFELSLDFPDDLDLLQADSFTFATLTFDALSQGTSPLGININALGDAYGDPLDATVSPGSVKVPEPSTLLLLGSGLFGLALGRRVGRGVAG
jgi:hypothetical protein